jgi:electron transfer flavoprotein beta subunit
VKLLVPVKQVARLAEDAVLDDAGRLVPESLEWQLNEWDAFAVEAALALVEAEGPGAGEAAGAGEGAGEVVVATVGGEHAEAGLRSYLAMGADRAVRIWDSALHDADALAVASVLAALATREQPDLILCGAQSSDAANAATGIAVAGLLELPHVAVVNAIERDGARLIVQRELDGGAVEVLGLSLPALLSVQTGINEPRHATLRAIKQAREKPLARLGLDELGLDADTLRAGAGARIVRLVVPERDAHARMIEGSAEEIAARIAAIVSEELAS